MKSKLKLMLSSGFSSNTKAKLSKTQTKSINKVLSKDMKEEKKNLKTQRNKKEYKSNCALYYKKNNLFSSLPQIGTSVHNTPKYSANITKENAISLNKKLKRTYHFIIRPENCGYLVKKCFEHRINWKEITEESANKSIITIFNFKWQQNNIGINFSSLSKLYSNPQMVNHFENHYAISNKANLFVNLIHYAEIEDKNIFQYIPFTVLFDYESNNFITRYGEFSNIFDNIEKYISDFHDLDTMRYNKDKFYNYYFPFGDKTGGKTPIAFPRSHFDGVNLWLIKAPNLNRGQCIKIENDKERIKRYIKKFYEGITKGYFDERIKKKGEEKEKNEEVIKTYHSNIIVVQKYIEKPLLFRGKKFDIRIWVLLTHKMEVYMFKEGHLKTCSVDYNPKLVDAYAHLTNYSFQKYNKNFSKYHIGNEVSYEEFQEALDEESKKENSKRNINFKLEILPKIKRIIEMVFYSARNKINCFDRKYCFEIFGFDFMIDAEYNPFLIEVNTNPGLEESSPLIKMLVPRMLDDALRLTVDTIFKTSYSFYDGDEFIEKYCPYISLFPVKGYTNTDNLWEYICNLNRDKDNKSRIIAKMNIKLKKYKEANLFSSRKFNRNSKGELKMY